ncbi:basic amino acid ABC transporter substrate-binding protein [Campylobacter ureolyticus]|uniref:basic amino acid ABC transporter substrate-binding protein n=1 Tax=Campylobacter ureolyticus TaxID=827 RepID=UPI00288AD9FF|nr:basic amino acid ABC transporter substrate-binding protein [Campylobacter ureolyticus]
MKKFLKILLIALACLNLANAKSLKVGTNASFPPFEFVDKNSQIVGFDMDLLDAVSKKVGFEYEIVNMGFDGLIPALKSGKIDMIAAGMSATEQRRKAADFTKPYYSTENVFLKKTDNDSIKSKDDIKGKIVSTQLGTVQEIAMRELKDIKVSTMKDPFNVIMALKNGKVDVVVFDSSVAYGYLKENPDLAPFHTEPDGSDGFSFAFNKGKQDELINKFNNAIEELKADGTYDKILVKYDLK